MPMDVKLVTALIGAGVSLVVTVLGNWLGPRGQRSVERLRAQLTNANEHLKHELDQRSDMLRNEFLEKLEATKGEIADQTSAKAARRDYEYDARKRLYAQVEPIFFQLYEALEEAHYRVRSLARSSRSENLGSGPQSWLANDGYYLRSTIYKLILPASYLPLIQRRITFIDLSLDSTIRLRYLLLKLYSRSFTDDFVFASLQPPLTYRPNSEEWKHLRNAQPQVYSRQALLVGDLENIAAALLREQAGTERVALFSEFETILDARPEHNDSLQELVDLFRGFSPGEKPVLARMLITQACLAQLILSTYHHEPDVPHLLLRLDALISSSTAKNVLAWTDSADGDGSLLKPARQYLAERLEWLYKDDTWLESEGPTETPAATTGTANQPAV
jgi:hypothetical protein